MPELHAVDPRQRNVDALTGQHAVAEHHPPVGDDEMRRQPIQERPHRQPADEQQPDRQRSPACTTVLRGLPQSVWLTTAAPNAATAADEQQQHRADQPLPVRMAVQHHPFVGGQHVIRITHDRKLYPALTGRKWAMSPADTVNTSSPVSMRSLPISSTSTATPTTVALARQDGPHPGADRDAARAVVGGKGRVGAAGSAARRRSGAASCAQHRLDRAPSRSTAAPSIAQRRARRASSAPQRHVEADADDDDRRGAATSARMPASLPSPTSTSFGHLRPAVTPATSATASTTATPVTAAASPTPSLGTSPAPTPTDSVDLRAAAASTSFCRACRGPRSGARRSAPRRRCPRLRRRGPAGRHWWSRSPRRRRCATVRFSLQPPYVDSIDHHDERLPTLGRARRRPHRSTSTPPRASWPICASGPKRRCTRSARRRSRRSTPRAS